MHNNGISIVGYQAVCLHLIDIGVGGAVCRCFQVRSKLLFPVVFQQTGTIQRQILLMLPHGIIIDGTMQIVVMQHDNAPVLLQIGIHIEVEAGIAHLIQRCLILCPPFRIGSVRQNLHRFRQGYLRSIGGIDVNIDAAIGTQRPNDVHTVIRNAGFQRRQRCKAGNALGTAPGYRCSRLRCFQWGNLVEEANSSLCNPFPTVQSQAFFALFRQLFQNLRLQGPFHSSCNVCIRISRNQNGSISADLCQAGIVGGDNRRTACPCFDNRQTESLILGGERHQSRQVVELQQLF